MKLCDACGRHVREEVCPFCGAPVTSAPLPRARGRGSRTARLLSVAALGVACGGTTAPTDGGSSDGSSDAPDETSIGPMYGAVMPDAGDATVNDAAGDASDASDEDVTGTALYGAPPPPPDQ